MRQGTGLGGRSQVGWPIGVIQQIAFFMAFDETVLQTLTKFDQMAHDMAGDPIQTGLELVFFFQFGDGPAKWIRFGEERVIDGAGGQEPKLWGRHEFRVGRKRKGAEAVIPGIALDQTMPANYFRKKG